MSGRVLAGEVVTFAGRLVAMTRAAASELVVRHGGTADADVTDRTTMLVVGGEFASPENLPGAAEPAAAAEGDASRRLARVAEVNARQPGRVRILTEDRFCEIVGAVTPAALRTQYYSSKTVRSLYPTLREDRLRYLEKWGVLGGVVRGAGETHYSFADVAVIRHAHAELERGATLRAVLRALAAERAGQLELDFRPAGDGRPATVVAMAPRPPRTQPASAASPGRDRPLTAAEGRFLEAERIEASSPHDVEATLRAYRAALHLDPGLVPALINLGNVHYGLDELPEAHALYLQAALVDPACVEAHFNLGNVHHDLERYEQAVLCYARALRLAPDRAETHFYLAVTLEKLGRSADAKPHWRQYCALAPDGEWVDLAREFSEG